MSIKQIQPSEVLGLWKTYFKRDTIMSHPHMPGELQQEAEKGTLYSISWEHGLVLLRKREKRFLLSCFLCPGQEAYPVLSLPEETVAEAVFRPEDKNRNALEAFFVSQGMMSILSRLRYQCEEGKSWETGKIEEDVTEAAAGDSGRVCGFLQHMFPVLTGCVPSAEQLEKEKVFLIKQEEDILGVLHWQQNRGNAEIRHLAVAPQQQGKGFAKKLLACFFRDSQGKRLVWTGAENLPARKLYEAWGFTPDGWTAQVYYKGKEHTI